MNFAFINVILDWKSAECAVKERLKRRHVGAFATAELTSPRSTESWNKESEDLIEAVKGREGSESS